MCDLLLLYFLLQSIKFWRGKKLTKGYFKTIAQFFDRYCAWILTFTV